jgi:hypothetical protein
MTKALAPHTPSMAASLIRPSRLELMLLAPKSKSLPPQGCPARSRGRGWLALGLPFCNNFSSSVQKPPMTQTFRRLGRNQAPRFVVVRLTKRVRRNHAFRERRCFVACRNRDLQLQEALHLSVEHQLQEEIIGGPNLRTKRCSGRNLGPETEPESGGSTCSQPVKVCR